MTERITSSTELRGFVADNTGRRKIDTEASLELHIRAATQLDLLSQQVADLQARLTDAGSPAASPAPVSAPPSSDVSESAMMLLRNAQTAADETLAEAARMKVDAALALEKADSHAQAKADAALQGAQAKAREVVDAAEVEAAEIVSTNQKAVDRALFIQRQYVEKAGALRREAEALVEFSRQVESLAETEMDLPADQVAHAAPIADVAAALPAPPVAEDALVEVADIEPPAPEVSEDTKPASQFLPPPPPPPPASDILDLTEAELDDVLDDASIDEELFGDEVIDIRSDAQERA